MQKIDFNSYEAALKRMLEEVDDPCVDNIRFAWLDDTEACQKYAEAKQDGCCGSFDREISINGREANIGCNYGH